MVILEKIKYYDEVLTMSAYMAAFTHEVKWMERYDNAVHPLESTLLQARSTFPEIIAQLDEIEEEVENIIQILEISIAKLD